MSKIEIDFNNLKYNLYEILNVKEDADDVKIKKSFMKIVKIFHPDKNKELEEDIYNHIILANQILLNKESRKKYDEYLYGKANNFLELKQNFNKSMDDIKSNMPKTPDMNLFNNKIEELNKKHNYNKNIDSENVMDKFKQIKNSRDIIKIQKEDFNTIDEFNSKFTHGKEYGRFKDQLVEYKQNYELSSYTINDNYTQLGDIDKLYVEDSVQNSKFSSLDRAFMLQPIIKYNNDKSLDEKMKEYQSQINKYKEFDKNKK